MRMATKRHRKGQRLLLSSYEAFHLQEIGLTMMGLTRLLSRLKKNVSRTFRGFQPHPSVDVRIPGSHIAANGQEVHLDQEYGDCSLGENSEAAALMIQRLVP